MCHAPSGERIWFGTVVFRAKAARKASIQFSDGMMRDDDVELMTSWRGRIPSRVCWLTYTSRRATKSVAQVASFDFRNNVSSKMSKKNIYQDNE